MLRITLAYVVGIGVLFAAACADGNRDKSTPTAAPTSSPTSAGIGVPAIIEQVTKAVHSNEPARLEALIQYQTISCISTPSGEGSPPLCGEGEAGGTPVEAIISANCAFNYVRKDRTASVVRNAVGTDNKLWAAYEYTGEEFGPGAAYFIIFERPEPLSNGTGYGIVTTTDHVVGIHYGCGWSPKEFGRHTEFGPAVIPPTS